MASQDTTATAAEVASGTQYPDYVSDSGKWETLISAGFELLILCHSWNDVCVCVCVRTLFIHFVPLPHL